jgi:hypothetical protein
MRLYGKFVTQNTRRAEDSVEKEPRVGRQKCGKTQKQHRLDDIIITSQREASSRLFFFAFLFHRSFSLVVFSAPSVCLRLWLFFLFFFCYFSPPVSTRKIEGKSHLFVSKPKPSPSVPKKKVDLRGDRLLGFRKKAHVARERLEIPLLARNELSR